MSKPTQRPTPIPCPINVVCFDGGCSLRHCKVQREEALREEEEAAAKAFKAATIESMIPKAARLEIISILRHNRIPLPTTDHTPIKRIQGEPTMLDLIRQRLSQHGDRIRAETAKKL